MPPKHGLSTVGTQGSQTDSTSIACAHCFVSPARHGPDTEVLKRARLQSIHTLLKRAQLRRIDHVVRMSDERPPERLLYGELSEGRRSTGGQRKRYKDSFKSSLKAFEINNEFWGT